MGPRAEPLADSTRIAPRKDALMAFATALKVGVLVSLVQTALPKTVITESVPRVWVCLGGVEKFANLMWNAFLKDVPMAFVMVLRGELLANSIQTAVLKDAPTEFARVPKKVRLVISPRTVSPTGAATTFVNRTTDALSYPSEIAPA